MVNLWAFPNFWEVVETKPINWIDVHSKILTLTGWPRNSFPEVFFVTCQQDEPVHFCRSILWGRIVRKFKEILNLCSLWINCLSFHSLYILVSQESPHFLGWPHDRYFKIAAEYYTNSFSVRCLSVLVSYATFKVRPHTECHFRF